MRKVLVFFILLLSSINLKAAPTINFQGEYVKHDKAFIYVKNKGAKNLIRLPKKYALNSPTNIPEKFKINFSIPAREFIRFNTANSTSKSTSKK